MFPCSYCGCCCRNLNKSSLYTNLDRGDGICKYLKGNLCSIYTKRPLLCRIDDCYDLYFKSKMTQEEYYKLNMIVCQELKRNSERG